MNLHWLFRMAQWARNPPSARTVVVVFCVVAFCIGLYAIEQMGWWPEGMTAERMRWR